MIHNLNASKWIAVFESWHIDVVKDFSIKLVGALLNHGLNDTCINKQPKDSKKITFVHKIYFHSVKQYHCVLC